VLNTLGTIDYGIYNVVGGIVVMFSFLSGTMATASQRFFAYELGRNDIQQLKKTFSLIIIIYAIIAVIIFLLAETVGLWFLNKMMVIPLERMEAANWIYQFSILSFLVTIMTIPYNAVIIARENMKVFAYVSIVEVILKLAIVYILVWGSFDKLKVYACLMFATTCIVTYTYRKICKRRYEECRFQYFWERDLFKTLISYSGWNLFGAMAGILNNQGINILLNLFFGPAINATRTIAYQINVALNQFVSSFIQAANPQITKYYAANKNKEMQNLVFKSSKFSFFLLFSLSMPLLFETDYILILWLKDLPEYVVIFTRLIVIVALIDTLSYPLMTAAQATGNIKVYQSIVGGFFLLNLPISYYFLKINFPPQTTMYIAIIVAIMCLFLRLRILKTLIGLSVKLFFEKVLLPIIYVAILANILPLILYSLLNESLLRFFYVFVTSIVSSVFVIYFIGLYKSEKQMLKMMLSKYIWH